MKNAIKKFITCFICCVLFGMSTSFQIPVEAKVIEPEIVKIETWTTSYFIDKDVDTLYPYIQCEADIYNDGTIKLYMWNTHEWDGFSTVKHTITFSESIPLQRNSDIYTEYTFLRDNGKTRKNEDFVGFFIKPQGNYSSSDLNYESDSFGSINLLNISVFPSEYNGSYLNGGNLGYLREPDVLICVRGENDPYNPYGFNGNSKKVYPMGGLHPYSIFDSRVCALCDLTSFEQRPSRNQYTPMVFTPNEDPTGTYNFRLYGHDITITPELLSGDIVAKPVLTEQEKYILELEEQNKYLTEQLNNYKSVDVDKDDMITAVDAQVMLQYYVASLVGKYSGRVEDYGDYVSKTVKTNS